MSRTPRLLTLTSILLLIVLVPACGGGGPKAPLHDKRDDSFDGELIITPPALEALIKVYFATKSKEQDGWMLVHDDQANADLKMKLDKVHAVDPAPETSPGHFYVRADMTDATGSTYGVDFVYKKTSRGIEVGEVLIAKSPDKTRYEWVKDPAGRFWVRQPMGEARRLG